MGKVKTHKASAKRFKLTKSGKLMHYAQGGGSGHSRNYMNRRQRKARDGKSTLTSGKQTSNIKRALGI